MIVNRKEKKGKNRVKKYLSEWSKGNCVLTCQFLILKSEQHEKFSRFQQFDFQVEVFRVSDDKYSKRINL